MNWFATIVYTLCFLTSGACAILLGRGYLRSSVRMLMWSALCFVFLAANSLTVIIDLTIYLDVDLRLLRHALSAAAVSVLLFGFIWDLED